MGVPHANASVRALRLCGSACDGAAPATVRHADQVLVTVCGIPNSAELGVRIQNSAELSVLGVIL